MGASDADISINHKDSISLIVIYCQEYSHTLVMLDFVCFLRCYLPKSDPPGEYKSRRSPVGQQLTFYAVVVKAVNEVLNRKNFLDIFV